MAVDHEGRADRRDDAPRERRDGLGLRGAVLRDGELVPAQARDQVGVAYRGLQPRGDLPQQPVADGVAERIVHLLEVVEVDAQQCEGRIAPRAQQRVLDPRHQLHAIRQAGQVVVPRKVADACLGRATFRDVLNEDHAAPALHRPSREGQDAPTGGFLRLVGRVDGHDLPPLLHHFLDRAVREMAIGVAQAQHLGQGHAGPQRSGRQAEQLVEPFVHHDQLLRPVVHAQAVRHVVQRRLEAQRLDADLGKQALEGAVRTLQLLRHQRHGAVDASAIAFAFLVAGQHQATQCRDVDSPVRGARAVHLPRKQPRHLRGGGHGHAASRSSVTVMVWLCSTQYPPPSRGASSP